MKLFARAGRALVLCYATRHLVLYVLELSITIPIHATVVGTTRPASYRGLRAIGTLVVATGPLL